MPGISTGTLEFRVLTGAQTGCRLLLKSGLYRAGGDESCDILLAGDGSPETAFSLHVGHQEIAIEAGTSPVTVSDEQRDRTHGPVPLPAGQIFAASGILYAVDHADAPWPDTPAMAMEAVDTDTPRTDASAVVPTTTEPVVATASAAPLAPSAVAPAPTFARPRAPFWLIWLGGTAIFIGVGLFVLLLSLRPSVNALPLHRPDSIALELEQTIAATKGGARLELDRLTDGRWRVRGHVDSRARHTELTRALRTISPGIVLQFSADEDLLALARDLLKRFKQPDLEAASLRFGELTLRGRVASTNLLDRIGRTLLEETPGLHTIQADVATADILPARAPTAAVPSTSSDNVVVAVLGPVPYVVLDSGGKEGRQTGTPSTQGPQWSARP